MPHLDNNDNERHSLDELEAAEQEELAKERKAKAKIFNPFSRTYSDSDGVSKDEKQIWENPNLMNFFKLLGRKLNQILSVNLMMVFGNFPLFFALFAMSGYASIHSTAPSYAVFPPLYGAMRFDPSPATSSLFSIFGRQSEITVLTTTDYVFFALTALILFTFGITRVGTTYILRNLFRGEGVFLWHDFWHAIKRNLRQAIVFGIIDVVIIVLLAYDIFFFHLNYSLSMVMSTMFFMSLFLALLYFFMRTYIYLMIVTVDLSLYKLFKNALALSIVGIKRNLMAFLGVLLVAGVEYLLLYIYFPLGVILPFVILFSLCAMMGIYAAYPVILKHVIRED